MKLSRFVGVMGCVDVQTRDMQMCVQLNEALEGGFIAGTFEYRTMECLICVAESFETTVPLG
jgi:hypothetical protein